MKRLVAGGVCAIAAIVILVMTFPSAPRHEAVVWSPGSPVYTVAQLQHQFAQHPRRLSGAIVRVRGIFVQLCSQPSPTLGSSCLLPRYPGEPPYGIVDSVTQDNDRDLQRSLPVLGSGLLRLLYPGQPLPSFAAAILRLPLVRHSFLSTLLGGQAGADTTISLRDAEVRFIVQLVVFHPCTPRELPSTCVAAMPLGTW